MITENAEKIKRFRKARDKGIKKAPLYRNSHREFNKTQIIKI
jgi:hypothetical protein